MRTGLERIGHWLLAVSLSLGLSGCESLAYYQQGVRGEMQVLRARRPIPVLLADSRLDARLRARLEIVQRIRQFAGEQLALPVAHQYDTYADIGRHDVAWAVIAAPTYSLQARRWCYPVVGCLDYHGFFDEARARRYAQALSRHGFDIYVAPVQAFSTLGWFRDPVLNGFLDLPEPDLAELIFHELAHQRLFFKGDTAFNESFATAVAEAGVERYAAAYHLDLSAWRQQRQAQQTLTVMLMQVRRQLAQLYAQDHQTTDLASAKAHILQTLQQTYAEKSQHVAGLDAYAAFVKTTNNASLVTVADYHDLVPAFTRLLARDQGDFARFFADCQLLRRLHPDARRLALHSLDEKAAVQGGN